MTHKHHIIPKYEGGSDFAENIVELTVTQHAMWHFAEWQRKGRWQDKLAWQGLSNMIQHEEAISKARIEGAKLGGSRSWSNMTEEEKINRVKKMHPKGAKVGRGYTWNEKAKEKRKKSKWWTDGKTTKFTENCPGEGWVRGRGKISKAIE